MPTKGMSQSIALIISATVLMMTALVAIFIAQGGLGDTEKSITSSGCLNVLRAKCPTDSGQVSAPSTCFDEDGNPVGQIPSGTAPGDDVSCSIVGEGSSSTASGGDSSSSSGVGPTSSTGP